MAAERIVWYLWAESLVLAIPNNSGQSHQCMVMCLQKSRANLVSDESQAPFSSMFLSTGYSEAILMFIYTRGYVFCIPSNRHPRLQQVEQVRKHCKAQRLPCPVWKGYKNIFSSYEVENYLPLVVGGQKIEMKLLQRCCEAFVEYLRRYRARSQTWNIHNLNKNAKFSYT